MIATRLGGQKEEIDADATTWDPVRARHEILHAVGSAAKLGRPYLNILQDRTGLTPERLAVIRSRLFAIIITEVLRKCKKRCL